MLCKVTHCAGRISANTRPASSAALGWPGDGIHSNQTGMHIQGWNPHMKSQHTTHKLSSWHVDIASIYVSTSQVLLTLSPWAFTLWLHYIPLFTCSASAASPPRITGTVARSVTNTILTRWDTNSWRKNTTDGNMSRPLHWLSLYTITYRSDQLWICM